MIRSLVLSLLVMVSGAAKAAAQDVDLSARVTAAVEQHVLPSYARFATSARDLSRAAYTNCNAEDEALRGAYHAAFDDWVRVSHLRFGPSETDNRAFALAFWPDSRSKTPKALAGLIAEEVPAGLEAAELMQQSIAVQGFYALDYLLYDPTYMTMGAPEYRCELIRNLSEGIAVRAEEIDGDWGQYYAAQMIAPSKSGAYHTTNEAAGELLKAVATGLQFTEEARLARPLGTFDRPRPKRAEAWRSGRSLRHVVLSLEATRDLTAALAGETSVAARLDGAFETVLNNATFDDPAFAGVKEPIARLTIESLQQYVNALREQVVAEMTVALDVSIGFNALDGD
ncbi:Iron-regulated protein A precursor [Shimia sp. SK013]|uniref:imelysin family protein n=1 Tax=Shimia sp. SK013 TaxID=1389006 RepID=UPI0006B4FF9E|nr:imelysin family protein [Shimia sp. SK013]KPA23579.1 Iron-regulated protein A precursor [Shimia sp. SK013]